MLKKALSILTVSTVVLLLGALGLSVALAQEPTVTRTFSSPTVAPGDTVMVEIAFGNVGATARITETLPAGFTYVSSSVADENVRVTGQEVRFSLFEVTSPFTYTVTASDMADSYDFSGMLRVGPGMDHAVGGDSTVTVQADASTPMSTPAATRSFDMANVGTGDTVMVEIAFANAGATARITETLPAGFTYVSSSVADENVRVTGQEVRFSLFEVTSPFTYTVTASDMADSYDFSGMLRVGPGMDHAVGGDSTVTVQADASTPMSTPAATRSFDMANVGTGDTVMVEIAFANAGATARITETLPAGFTYVSSSVADENVRVTGQEVRFSLFEVTSPFTYTVTASDMADSYDFSGMLRVGPGMDHAVGGDSTVTVGPYATRSFSPTSVSPGGRVMVEIAFANVGATARITETLPAGFTYVSSSVADENVRVTGQEVRFSLFEVTSPFTYRVTASRAASSYDFSGMLRVGPGMDHAVGGNSSVSVRTPSTGTGGTGGGGGTDSGGDTGGGTPATTTPVGSPPIIAGGTREEFNVSENMTAVTSLSIVDGRRVTWNISGGFDAAEFTIGAESGELMFRAAPDFENPTDEGADNVYVVVVGATDSDTLSDTLLVLVTVTDVVDESTATPTPEPTAEPTAEPTVAPTAMPTLEPTAAPTATPVATSMPEPTATSMPEPTATSMPEPTATSMPVATATSAPVATATSMPAPTATSMPEPTATSMPEPTATSMPAPTAVAPEEPGGGFPILVVILIALVVVGAGAAFYIRSRR